MATPRSHASRTTARASGASAARVPRRASSRPRSACSGTWAPTRRKSTTSCWPRASRAARSTTTSRAWTSCSRRPRSGLTRELIETIETALDGIEGPALRFGVGLRLFFAKAQADPALVPVRRARLEARRPRAACARSRRGVSARRLSRAERRGRARSALRRRASGAPADGNGSDPARLRRADDGALPSGPRHATRAVAAVMKYPLPSLLPETTRACVKES